MSKTVMTAIGPLPYAEMDIQDYITETPTSREIATEYKYKGEIVKRDAWVCLLMPATLTAEGGTFGE